MPHPAVSLPRKRPATSFTEGSVGPRADWTGAESVAPNSDLIPREVHPWQVAKLPSPFWPTLAGVYQMVMKMTCACSLTTDYLDRGDF